MLPIIGAAVVAVKALHEFSKTPAGQAVIGGLSLASAEYKKRKLDATWEERENARRSGIKAAHKVAGGVGGVVGAAVVRRMNKPRPPGPDWV
ncbi:hypothetical protein ACH437_13935 [Streptomyces xinghaiensis]|uniref:hypothetical protein n=1 Tax=Streptomyces xinghaiensis TaxID=1038928 RepID=UPI0037B2D443